MNLLPADLIATGILIFLSLVGWSFIIRAKSLDKPAIDDAEVNWDKFDNWEHPGISVRKVSTIKKPKKQPAKQPAPKKKGK